MNADTTEGLDVLGPNDGKWLGEYSQVHMNVFGTPLRVMDHANHIPMKIMNFRACRNPTG